ncbi:M14 family zinc carboxypeptidase [Actinoplanes sp. NEAU-A12]|uniref:M14 family zinc carboxypeptidase n=1 Tax=Actinoplanes sandaracinus TaxID=3045177 RepID=A0ABT6WSW4_9ACTN|nr:M14 family zinc carboxypeptidase [Actinoplanes sandaracinus]MDI6102808.1 M14 family zinc carboxypeptidase [Actinoplanes sandaracinus]
MRSTLAALVTTALLGAGLLAPPAAAATPPAAAPPVTPEQLVTLVPSRLVPSQPSPGDVRRALARVARDSAGRVRLGVIGRSNEGRALRLATVGHGPTRLLYVTQQHGDEPLGTPAAIRALWALGVPDSAWHRALRSRVTIDVVVQANPDGAVRDQRWNHDPSASGEYAEPGVGYDINRYHNPLTPTGDNPVPEARAVLRWWHRTEPRIVVDYHMQGRYQQPDGRETTASVLWPTSALVTPAAVTTGRQLAVRTDEATTRFPGAYVTRYPGGDYEGIARNGYGILGSASLLVELSALPHDRVEFQIRTAFASMIATAQGAADGSLWRTDPARADRIPARGPALPGLAATLHDAA